jgi:hypothetical protein
MLEHTLEHAIDGPIDHPAVLIVGGIIAIVVLLVIVTAWQNRRYLRRTERKQCPHCNGLFPAAARYCGRCGKAF